MATFTGTNGAEILPDLIIGPVQGIGNDFVDALGGDDIAIGWSGDDVLRGGAGADVIIGGQLNAAGIITLAGIDAADYTTSVAGVTINLSEMVNLTLPMHGINLQLTGASQGFGGDAQGDYLVGIVNLIGSNTGGDTLTGSAAANTFNGQGGNDTLDGQGGNDILLGGAGDDVLIGGSGADSLQGGSGTADTADYSSSATAVTVNLTTGSGSGGDAQGDTLTGIERLVGSANDDILTGSAGNNTLSGGAGADTLNGGGGIDTVDYSTSDAAVNVSLTLGLGIGGDGQGDILNGISNLIGSAHADVLVGDVAANTLSGLDGDDTLDGGAGADMLNGGAGIDTAEYSASAAAVTVNLATGVNSGGDAQGDTLTAIEDLRGSDFDDMLTGDGGANELAGGVGADTLDGGGGVDTADYSASATAVTVNLTTGVNSGGDAEGDTLTAVENIHGSGFGDSLTGDGGANGLTGGDGDDTIAGGGGDDKIDGGDGSNDVVVFSGNRVDYTVTFDGTTSTFTIVDNRGGSPDGTDQVTKVENFQFADGTETGETILNDAPTVPSANTVSTNEDTASLAITIGATDLDSDTLVYAVKPGFEPTRGSVSFSGDTFVYTPSANANGMDSFVIVVSDGRGGSAEQTVTVAIAAVNDAPIGSPTAALPDGAEDQPYVVSAAALLAGFSDVEGDPLSVANLAVVGGGTVADNGDGTYTIILPENRSGSVLLSYLVSDGQGGLTPAMQNFQIVGDGDEAVFSGDTRGTVVEAGLTDPGTPTASGTLTVSDPDGSATLRPIIAGTASSLGFGSVQLALNGDWTYTLDNDNPGVEALAAGETLTDHFIAYAMDGTPQVVLITITGADDGIRIIHGTPGDDTLISTMVDETIAGGRGFDTAVFSGELEGYRLTRLTDGSVEIVDIDPFDGDDGRDILTGIEMLRFGAADAVTLGSLVGQPAWTLESEDVALTAAAYQFFTGKVPSAEGFEYLILSSNNPNDLNDPYYAGFNLENLYLNFASNLGTAGAGSTFFETAYGSLGYEQMVKAAYLDIVGDELTGAALDFFLGAEDYYEAIAASRVVRPGVDLVEATKIVAIGSILYEAVRADAGLLGEAVNDFAQIVAAAGTAEDFGQSLFATV